MPVRRFFAISAENRASKESGFRHSVARPRPREDLGLAALIALLAAGGLLLLPATFLEGYDYIAMHGFNREYFRKIVLAGGFPWWNPFTALGRPFFADIETGCLYPPNWLVIPLGVTLGVVASVALHLFLALLGMRRLAQTLGVMRHWDWVAALGFVGCGPVLARLQLGQISVFHSLCWLPFLFLLGIEAQDKSGTRPIVKLAFAITACLLAGSPNVFWLGGLGLGVFLAVRCETWRQVCRLAFSFSSSLALSVCVGAIQWLPSAELILAGNRPLEGGTYATRHALHFTTWSSLVAPLIGVFRFAPEFNLYIGLPFTLAGLIVIARNQRDRTLRALAVLGFTAAILASGDQLPVLGWLSDRLPGFGSMRFPSRYGVLVAFSLLLAGGIGMSRLTIKWGRLGRSLMILQLGLLFFAATRLAGFYAIPAKNYWDKDLKADLEAHGLFSENGVPPRISFAPAQVRANSGLVQGYSTLNGFANPMLRTVWDAAHSESATPATDFDLHELTPALFQKGPFPMASAALIGGWDPKYNVTVFRSASDAPPRAWLIELKEGGDDHPTSALESHVTIDRFEPDSILITTSSRGPCVLIVAEPYYPGWRATCDGNETPVRLVQNWMRGVNIAPGTHTVLLKFRPRWFWPGAGLSLFGIIACSLLWRNPPHRN